MQHLSVSRTSSPATSYGKFRKNSNVTWSVSLVTGMAWSSSAHPKTSSSPGQLSQETSHGFLAAQELDTAKAIRLENLQQFWKHLTGSGLLVNTWRKMPYHTCRKCVRRRHCNLGNKQSENIIRLQLALHYY